MNVNRKKSSSVVWVAFCMLLGVSKALEKRSASASPTPSPDPNLSALSGLGGISALAGGAAADNGDGTCGNQDFLTNLLVYQYLSGNVPNGALPPGANPQLQALLSSSQGPATTTVTSVTTTLTTLIADVEPSTQFITSTTSYVTTLTSIETKIIPVLFRGSKITTTISESTEEVITATEFFTESSVHSPTIVQTLPVHITMTATSTRGLNGQYTLLDVTPGASSVVHQPISTATVDLDAAGLDLGNLDLTQLDLTSLNGGGIGGLSGLGLPGGDVDNSQMLSVLSSLLQNFDENGAAVDFDSFHGANLPTGRSGNGRGQQDKFRTNRFQEAFQNDYPDYDAVFDEAPKFNVLKGFTLSDRTGSSDDSSLGQRPRAGAGSGRAATDTRYSKYHKRPEKVENNGISSTDSNSRDRESERFSASTRRRTFSRSSRQQRHNKEESTPRPPSTRFVPAAETQYFEDGPPKFRPFGARNDRHTSPRRRAGLITDSDHDRSISPIIRPTSAARSLSRPKQPVRNAVPAAIAADKVRTTVLTMYLSGSMPGEFSTSLRTVTLRSLPTRRRRDINDDLHTKISPTETATPISAKNTVFPETFDAINSNEIRGVNPKEIVHLLKSLNRAQVRKMLESLQKWVDYYNHEVLDDVNISEKEGKTQLKNSIVPELTSSINLENPQTDTEATKELTLPPSSILGAPSSSNLCHSPPTVTETVYRTFVITSESSAP